MRVRLSLCIVSGACTTHPQSTPLTLDGTILKESAELMLWVTFGAEMTFEKHLCLVSRAAAQRLCIKRKSWPIFNVRSLLRYFLSFVSTVSEYWLTVWCSAAD